MRISPVHRGVFLHLLPRPLHGNILGTALTLTTTDSVEHDPQDRLTQL